MWWNNAGWGASDWLGMSFMMLIFWAAVAAVVFWVVRGVRRAPPVNLEPTAVDQADRVLAGRFARGEIDEAEFTRSRAMLRTPTDRP